MYRELICPKCQNVFTTTHLTKKFCSQRCSKLYLKSQYRKRNKDKLKEYRKKYRDRCEVARLSGLYREEFIWRRGKDCYRCYTPLEGADVQIHHIKPRSEGGGNEYYNLMVLCRNCHMEWEKRMKGYWNLDE